MPADPFQKHAQVHTEQVHKEQTHIKQIDKPGTHRVGNLTCKVSVLNTEASAASDKPSP